MKTLIAVLLSAQVVSPSPVAARDPVSAVLEAAVLSRCRVLRCAVAIDRKVVPEQLLRRVASRVPDVRTVRQSDFEAVSGATRAWAEDAAVIINVVSPKVGKRVMLEVRVEFLQSALIPETCWYTTRRDRTTRNWLANPDDWSCAFS